MSWFVFFIAAVVSIGLTECALAVVSYIRRV